MIKVFVNDGDDIEFALETPNKEISMVSLFQSGAISPEKQLIIKKGENNICILVSKINNMQYIEVKPKRKPIMEKMYDDLMKISRGE